MKNIIASPDKLVSSDKFVSPWFLLKYSKKYNTEILVFNIDRLFCLFYKGKTKQ